MRTSPLLLTFLVLAGLSLIAVPMWSLTTADVASAQVDVNEGEETVAGARFEAELLVWVSHVPAEIVVSQGESELARIVFEPDGLQEEVVTVDMSGQTGAMELDVRADFSDVEGAPESAVEIGLLGNGEEKQNAMFRVSGFADERVVLTIADNE